MDIDKKKNERKAFSREESEQVDEAREQEAPKPEPVEGRTLKIKKVLKPLHVGGKNLRTPNEFEACDDAFLKRNASYFVFD